MSVYFFPPLMPHVHHYLSGDMGSSLSHGTRLRESPALCFHDWQTEERECVEITHWLLKLLPGS